MSVTQLRSDPPETAAIRGSAYAELIRNQLDEERKRKSSLEERGLRVVTTSGVLVTLLFGLAAFGHPTRPLTSQGRGAVAMALVLFVIAVLAGLWTQIGKGYNEAGVKDMYALVEPEEWEKPDAAEGARRVAKLDVAIIKDARDQNGPKALVLNGAILAEVLAVSAVAVAVATVVANG